MVGEGEPTADLGSDAPEHLGNEVARQERVMGCARKAVDEASESVRNIVPDYRYESD